MANERRHAPFLNFISKANAVAAGYSFEALMELNRRAREDFPAYVRLIDAYLELVKGSETSARMVPLANSYAFRMGRDRSNPDESHLFDLLRSKTLFKTNQELADLAARVLPGMVRRRFNKMSRGDIAARIIEYLETLEPSIKRRLEESMREAIQMSRRGGTKPDRMSFFAKWEKIIKGIEL